MCWMVRGSNMDGSDVVCNLYISGLGPTQPPVQWVMDLFMGRKAAGK